MSLQAWKKWKSLDARSGKHRVLGKFGAIRTYQNFPMNHVDYATQCFPGLTSRVIFPFYSRTTWNIPSEVLWVSWVSRNLSGSWEVRSCIAADQKDLIRQRSRAFFFLKFVLSLGRTSSNRNNMILHQNARLIYPNFSFVYFCVPFCIHFWSSRSRVLLPFTSKFGSQKQRKSKIKHKHTTDLQRVAVLSSSSLLSDQSPNAFKPVKTQRGRHKNANSCIKGILTRMVGT